MIKRILKRVCRTALTLLGVALILFLILRLIPGNAVMTAMGEHIDPEIAEKRMNELGLDRPVFVQFFMYIRGLIGGNMGESFTYHKSVSSLIAGAFPNTVKLALLALLFSWVIGIPAGIISAERPDRPLDRIFTFGSLLNISAPVFLVAMLLQYFLAFKAGLFPLTSDNAGFIGLVLPALALSWDCAGSICLLIRSVVSDVLREDHITAVRAVGGRHNGLMVIGRAFRNAILPVISMMAMQFSSFLSGAVITESIFSVSGIGRLAVGAIAARDIPLIQGTVLLCTLIVLLSNLAADILYELLDPRIRTAFARRIKR